MFIVWLSPWTSLVIHSCLDYSYVSGFSSAAIPDFDLRHLYLGSQVFSNVLDWFRAVTTSNSYYKAVVYGGNF